jgi:cephalosporin-C deacetylase
MAFPLPRPVGFEAFWREAVEEALAAPLDYLAGSAAGGASATHQVRLLEFRGVDGSPRHGWIAAEEGSGPQPAFLWIPPYGRWSMPPNEYGTRRGMTSLAFNLHGESALHEEAYSPARGYFSEGIESKETWIFRRIFQDCVVAARVLGHQPEADPGRLGAMGMSQGGGLAIWLGAWFPSIRCVAADMPFLGGFGWVMDQLSRWRYPLKEVAEWIGGDPACERTARETLAWFDTVSQASECRVPTRVTLGLKDPAVRPEQARAIFEALPGPKELVELDWGHDWHPEMIEGGRQWLLASL